MLTSVFFFIKMEVTPETGQTVRPKVGSDQSLRPTIGEAYSWGINACAFGFGCR